MSSDFANAIVIFDGHCGVCTRLVDWIEVRDQQHRLACRPYQAPGLADLGVSEAEAARSVWVVASDGRRWHGAAAIAHILRTIGGIWALIAWPLTAPVLGGLSEAGYRWFARHRHWFGWLGATPACERPGAACQS